MEPNLDAKSINDISVAISQEDIALSQQVADQMFAEGLLQRKVNFDLAKQATEEIRKAGSKIDKVEIMTR